MSPIKVSKRRHATMACLACRESKVKVGSLQRLGSERISNSHSVMVGSRRARIAHTGVVNVATSLLIRESKGGTPLYHLGREGPSTLSMLTQCAAGSPFASQSSCCQAGLNSCAALSVTTGFSRHRCQKRRTHP